MHEYNNVRLNMKKMMYNFRRTIGIALSLMLVIVLFTACTDSPNDSTSSTDHPQQSETVPITEAPIESQTDSGKADETTVSDAVEADIVLPWEISEPVINYEETSENSVSLKLAEDSLTATGAEFKISNLSDKVVTTGNDYIIEVFRDGKWNYIDIGIVAFPAEAFIYEAGQTYDVYIDWTKDDGELPAADYRIIKEYSFDGSPDKYYCICEFSIEKEQ